MDDFTELSDEHFDHASWLTEQIGQMEQWISEKQSKSGADPNELKELENHLSWLKKEQAKHAN